ncbi:metal-dependent hydrolase [Actinocorallia sp. A-T 12471]|uniref:metal-dependent hydrolase n=1 Tax=Actinocorallia sp. A-T 12471 TaxID=3089813 RepID=UPI0029CB05DB|nr:metal-dependent hydrolase [Actinocorallia sp. A-T 12471]MDX6743253.1 metal-dependent hydrolase [Actinocorallia sp. A-T 12471]
MMGQTHALSGAALWLAAVPLLTSPDLLHEYAIGLDAAEIAAGTVVCAGAALLPDVDHPRGTIANTFGVFTRWLCKAMSSISGGHRHGTHSILFAVGAGYGAQWLADNNDWGWWVALFLLVGLGLRGLGVGVEGNDVTTGVLNALLAAGVVFALHGVDAPWAGYAVALGCLVHVAGDCCTPQGCPVLWPIPWRFGVPLVPRTDGKVERWIVTPLLTLGVAVLAVRTALGEEITAWLNTHA